MIKSPLVHAIVKLVKEKESRNDSVNIIIVKEMGNVLQPELNGLILEYLPHWTDWVECYFINGSRTNRGYCSSVITLNNNNHKIIKVKNSIDLNAITQLIEKLTSKCNRAEINHLYLLAMLQTSKWRSYYNYILSIIMTILWNGLKILNSQLFRAILLLISTICFSIWSYKVSGQVSQVTESFVKEFLPENIKAKLVFNLFMLTLAIVSLCSTRYRDWFNVHGIINHMLTWTFAKFAWLIDRYFSNFKIKYDANFQRHSYEQLLTIKNVWKCAF